MEVNMNYNDEERMITTCQNDADHEIKPLLNHEQDVKQLENESTLAAQTENTFTQKDNDSSIDNTISCPSDEDGQNNLLNSAVTMHNNMTNCDDEYSPTLAICDIFSKKDSSGESDTRASRLEEEDSEFLIIDLDTCKMEKATKKQNVSCYKTSPRNFKNKLTNSPSNGLISVNLSSSEIRSNFQKNKDDQNSLTCETNFLEVEKDCDISYHDHLYKHSKGTDIECSSYEKHTGGKTEIKVTEDNRDEVEFFMTDKTSLKNDSYQNKNMIFQDMEIPNDSVSNEMYSAEISFNASDLNLSLHSNETQDSEPTFYMPDLYTKFYEEDKRNDHSICTFTKMSTSNSSLETDNSHQYECAINESVTFDNSFTNEQDGSLSDDLYEQHLTHVLPHYNYDEKINKTIIPHMKKDPSTQLYGMLAYQQENMHVQSRVSATPGSCKLSNNSIISESTSNNAFYHSSCLQNCCTSYPYNNLPQAPQTNQPVISSDWSSWNGPAFSEVNLTSFASIHNTDSQFQEKEEWSDTNMTEVYPNPQMCIKSNQTDNDSEATEDADETDDVTVFLDNSGYDDLSNMSVMSSSCYSDSSSVMTPISPSDFTPPPSASNTPMSFGQAENCNVDDYRFNAPFINDNMRSDPIHLYSPTMLTVTPYKLDKVEHNFMNYGRNQSTRRHYPSMADVHNSRSGLSISSSALKFEEDEPFEFPDYITQKNQIQSDKISTSTSRSAYKRKWLSNSGKDGNHSMESLTDYMKQKENELQELRKLRHNEPLKQNAVKIMSQWYEHHMDNPYPTKEDKMRMARDGGITVTQVKSWFANKRNRTNNTKPKVQKRAMNEKLRKLFQDLKHSRTDSLDNAQIIQQLSGIIHT